MGRRQKRRPSGHGVERSCASATSLHAQAGGLPRRVLQHERPWGTAPGDKAEDRRGNTGGGGRPQRRGLAGHQWAQSPHAWASAPRAYRDGDPGRQLGNGARPATSAAPRVVGQGCGGPTRDGKARQTDAWGGWGALGDAGAASPGGGPSTPTGVSYPAVAPGVSRHKWGHGDTSSVDTVSARSGDAGPLPAGA